MSDSVFTRLGDCEIYTTARVCQGAIIGKPFRPLLDERGQAEPGGRTVIGANSYVGYFAIVGAGSVLSEGVIIDDYCAIESDVTIGRKSLVIYRSQICNEAQVGSRCVIGGFIAERVVVGDEVRVFGKIIHTQRNPSVPWDAPESEEPSAVLEIGAFVGFNALVVGGVRIGRRAYVCAGAIVTQNVPAEHVAFGVNKVIPASEWTGGLGRSPFFCSSKDEWGE
jgi:acetyltransferase-like isoleucine patch superfamily enzyme